MAILSQAQVNTLKRLGAQAAETFFSEMHDDNDEPRKPVASDFADLSLWSDGAINALGITAACQLIGVNAVLWPEVKAEWCDAYDAGANEVVEAARKDLEDGDA